MTATQDLIAAALRLTAIAERNTDDRDEWQHSISEVREMCARAMVQPDMAEVEKRLCIHENVVRMHANGAEFDKAPSATRTALIDYVRNHFVEADKMVDVPEIRFGNMPDCRTCAHFTADGCRSTVMCMEADQYKATVPRRYWATMSGEVKP